MGIIGKLGEFAKMGMEALAEEANKRQEYYDRFYETYSEYDNVHLKLEYEQIKKYSQGTDMKSLMRKKAFKDICAERGLIRE